MSGIKINLFRDGASKENRSLPALSPDSVQLDDRTIEDQLDTTTSLSQEIAYYNINNHVDGNWSPFFSFDAKQLSSYLNQLLDLDTVATEKIINRNLTPHLSLFLTFLALAEKLRSSVNNIPARHFLYFTNELLKLIPREGLPDRAILVLELSNNSTPFKLEQGVVFLGGKGFDQQDIRYLSEREIIVNHAQITDWRSSFRNTDAFSKIFITAATAAMKAFEKRLVPDEDGWMIFAPGKLQDIGLATAPAQTGWAVESPVLLMQEGLRVINMEAHVTWSGSIPKPINNQPVAIEGFITTTKGWLKVDMVLSEYRPATNMMVIRVQVPPQAPPIVSGEDILSDPQIRWPVLKFAIDNESNYDVYSLLASLTSTGFKITTTVTGMKNVVLQTTLGPATPGSPFLPYGPNPSPGTRFYIGVNELRYKNIEYINFAYKWKGPPANIPDYYKEYFSNGGIRPTVSDLQGHISHRGKVEVLTDGNWQAIESIDLFPPDPNAEAAWERFQFIPAPPSVRAAGITELTPLTLSPLNGYWSLSFDRLVNESSFNGPVAFGHDEYGRILTEIATGKASGNATYADVNLPNPPYTPQMEYLTVDYRAVESFDVFAVDPDNHFFHVSPFGMYEPDSVNNQIIPLHTEEGYLYLGIENLTAPSNLSFLLQLKEGGADAEVDPDDFRWSYLAGNRWINLTRQQVVIDQTFGMKTSGVVELSIPSNASTQHGVMPAGKHWLRLGVVQDTKKVNAIIDIQTHAITVVYNGDLTNKPRVLPEGSIDTLLGNGGEIKSITQPFPSFGGRDSESSASLYVRVHERLHHRDRSVSYWDYERLVLENFSDIYKTKTLQCTNVNKKNAPGHVTVIAVPDQRGNNILEPKCSQLLLDRIQQNIERKADPGATIHVVNPVYETVHFDFYVAFYPGLDLGFYQQQLNRELVAYISPWAFNKKNEIYFGSTFFKSDIIKFIESRDYVDFISQFEMYSLGGEYALYGIGEMKITLPGDLEEIDDFIIGEEVHPGIGEMMIDDNFIVGKPVSIAVPSSPSSILVSAPLHRVRLIENGSAVRSASLAGIGIGSMAIEIDFIIT